MTLTLGTAASDVAAALDGGVPAASVAYPRASEAEAAAWLDQRMMEGRYTEIHDAVAHDMASETRPALQWRLARALMLYFEVRPDSADDVKLKAYALAEKLTRGCLARDARGTPHCYLFLGISLGRMATVRGVMSSLSSGREIETTWLKGLELSRNTHHMLDDHKLEAHFHYVLGIYYRLVPDWWILSVVAGTRGDKEKSISFHRQSVKLRRDTSTVNELGVSLICRGEQQDKPEQLTEGKRVLQEVLDMKTASEIDVLDQRNARLVLANPKLACGYSRDKFQKIDEKPPN